MALKVIVADYFGMPLNKLTMSLATMTNYTGDRRHGLCGKKLVRVFIDTKMTSIIIISAKKLLTDK